MSVKIKYHVSAAHSDIKSSIIMVVHTILPQQSYYSLQLAPRVR